MNTQAMYEIIIILYIFSSTQEPSTPHQNTNNPSVSKFLTKLIYSSLTQVIQAIWTRGKQCCHTNSKLLSYCM